MVYDPKSVVHLVLEVGGAFPLERPLSEIFGTAFKDLTLPQPTSHQAVGKITVVLADLV